MAIIVKSPSWEADLGEKGYREEKEPQLSGNYCQKPFLGALSKGQLAVLQVNFDPRHLIETFI